MKKTCLIQRDGDCPGKQLPHWGKIWKSSGNIIGHVSSQKLGIRAEMRMITCEGS